MALTPMRSATALTVSATPRANSADSMTQGPAMKNGVPPSPTVMPGAMSKGDHFMGSV